MKIVKSAVPHVLTSLLTLLVAYFYLNCQLFTISPRAIEMLGHDSRMFITGSSLSIETSKGHLVLMDCDPPNWLDGPAIIGVSDAGREVLYRVAGAAGKPVTKETSFQLAGNQSTTSRRGARAVGVPMTRSHH